MTRDTGRLIQNFHIKGRDLVKENEIYLVCCQFYGRRHLGLSVRLKRCNRYLPARTRYYHNSNASFQSKCLLSCGDIECNPGPTNGGVKCSICRYKVKQKEKLKCEVCGLLSHIGCSQFKASYHQPITTASLWKWTCPACVSYKQSFPFTDINIMDDSLNDLAENKDDPLDESAVGIKKMRHKDARNILIFHLNVNSLQNKIEEIAMLVEDFKAQVVFLTETKIDKSYPNRQFATEGYKMYRIDRKKGGGGVMAYVASKLRSKKLKLPRSFSTIEVLAIEATLGRQKAIMFGVHRPPKASGPDYYIRLEDELNELCTWASLQKQFVIITGDLNLNRLRPDQREGKILCDLEEVHGLECLVTMPTRVTDKAESFLDVILTNKPHYFKESGVYNPEVSDHTIVYGMLIEKVKHHQSKVVMFRDFKKLDEESLRENLRTALWHVSEIFDSVDDSYDYWNTLFSTILDEHLPLKRMKVRAKDVPT